MKDVIQDLAMGNLDPMDAPEYKRKEKVKARKIEGTKVMTWERHLQTVLGALLLASILWGTNTLVDLKTKVEVFDTRMVNLQDNVRHTLTEQSKRIDSVEQMVRAKTDDRYRAQDAKRDFQLRDERLKVVISHCEKIERSVKGLERNLQAALGNGADLLLNSPRRN